MAFVGFLFSAGQAFRIMEKIKKKLTDIGMRLYIDIG